MGVPPRQRPPRSHTLPLRRAGSRGGGMGWDLQALVFPGRLFPAHTQRLGAPPRAGGGPAPAHSHSASERPKDRAVGNRTFIYPEAAREKPAWQAGSSQMLQLHLGELNLGRKSCG